MSRSADLKKEGVTLKTDGYFLLKLSSLASTSSIAIQTYKKWTDIVVCNAELFGLIECCDPAQHY